MALEGLTKSKQLFSMLEAGVIGNKNLKESRVVFKKWL